MLQPHKPLRGTFSKPGGPFDLGMRAQVMQAVMVGEIPSDSDIPS